MHCTELAGLFELVEEAFERANPDIDIRTDSASTKQTIRKLTDLSRRCDLVAVTDPVTLRTMLPAGAVGWVASFASDEIVLGGAGRSRYIHEMTPDNWYQILLRPDVSFARVDGQLDPLGRFTLMAWQLADLQYGQYQERTISEALLDASQGNNVRDSSTALMTLLQTPSGPDYAFVYRSMAVQHRQQFIELPAEINLGNPDKASDYARAELAVDQDPQDAGAELQKETGRPILFAMTIPADAPSLDAAIRLARFLLDSSGSRIMMDVGLRPVSPALVGPADIFPERLRPYVEASQ